MRILRFAMFFVVTLGVGGGVHVYLYRRLIRDVVQDPRARKWGRNAFIALVLGGALTRPLGAVLPTSVARVISLVFSGWLGFAIFAFFALLIFDLFRGIVRFAQKRSGAPELDPERRLFLSRALAGGTSVIGVTMVGFGAYRAFVPPQVSEQLIKLPHLPRALEGFTLVQLSDIHVGSVIQRRFLERLIDEANAQKPDALLITGDMVDGTVPQLGRFVSVLQKAQSRYGTFFCTGNHDYYSGADEWCAELSQLGVHVLRNRFVKIGDAGASFDLIGVDDWGTKQWGGDSGYDLDAAVQGRDPSRASVLMAHQPTNLPEVSRLGIGLQLSGHTHGGQVFPGTEIARAIWGKRNAGYSVEGNTQIYVSRGCGFVGPPMRVGSPPEIVKLVLVGA